MSNQHPADALLWIGRSYTGLLCKQQDCCNTEFKKHTRCYVHEAARRGCCRKVPFYPKWAVPGRTRVFLAHRGEQKEPHKAVIFGYFVLARIEGIAPAAAFSSLCSRDVRQLKGDPQTGDLMVRVLRADRGEPIRNAEVTATAQSAQEWSACVEKNGYMFKNLPIGPVDLQVAAPGYCTETVTGIAIVEKKKRTIDVYLTPRKASDGDPLITDCWDGSKIVTHIYKDGEWVPTGNECPEIPDIPCPDRKEIREKCWDGSEIVVARCVDGKWARTREKRPKLPTDQPDADLPGPSIDVTLFEEHRDCSLRIKARGIYLMDALAKEISEQFQADPQLVAIQAEFSKAGSDEEREQIVCRGRNVFNKLVDKARSTRECKTQIPLALESKAQLKGELVLFGNPPVFERAARAAFRGIIRVNGDRILECVAQGAVKIDLNACRASTDSGTGFTTQFP